MNKKECKKCVYYGGKRKGKILCLNDKCVKIATKQIKETLTNRKRVVY